MNTDWCPEEKVDLADEQKIDEVNRMSFLSCHSACALESMVKASDRDFVWKGELVTHATHALLCESHEVVLRLRYV